MPVQVTPQTIAFVQQLEGFTPKAQYDGTQYSNGYGTKASSRSEVIDQATAAARLATELQHAANYVNSAAPNFQPNANQNDSIISAAFNLGSFKSPLVSALNANDYASAAQHLAQYTGTYVPGTAQGVTNRRNIEVANFSGTSPNASAPTPSLTAAASLPPLPNLRPSDATTAAPAAPQPGSPGFVDNLGGGMSPLHQFSVAEPSDIPPGPYGAEAVLQAALSGDPTALQAAMASVMSAAIQKDSVFGIPNIGAIKNNLQSYFDMVQQQAPGAVRGVQTNLATNQALNAVVPDVLRPMLDSAFAALPPKSTGQVAMPNLRPPGGPSTPDPLVAGPTPDPLAPKMASFTPPEVAQSWLPPSLLHQQEAPPSSQSSGQMQAYPPGSPADAWLPASIRAGAQANAAQQSPSSVGTLVDKGPGQDFNFGFEPTAAMAGSKSPQQMAADRSSQTNSAASWLPASLQGSQDFANANAGNTNLSGWDAAAQQPSYGAPSPSAWDAGLASGPQQYWTPPPAPPSPSPYLSSLTGGYGAATQSTMGPSPMLSSLTGGYGAANGWLVPPTPPTKQLQIGQVPPAPKPMPQASPLATALVGPLQDYGSVTPPQTPQQQALYQAYQDQNNDSYLSYPAFSFGQ